MPLALRLLSFCVAGMFLLLPFARLKTDVFGLPLYTPEGGVILLLVLFLGVQGSYWHGQNSSPDRWAIFATALFLFGTLLSLFVHPLSFKSLGLFKTWFFFPTLMAVLILLVPLSRTAVKRSLLAWLFVTVSSSIGSLWFFFDGRMTYDGRLEAWFSSPNFLALFLAPGVPLAAYFLEQAFSVQAAIRQKALFMVSGALVIAAIFLTRSYGVWVATLLSLLVFFFTSGRRGKGGIAIVLILFCLVAVFFERGTEKWHSLISFDERSSLASRVMIWHAAGSVLADHPVLGIGLGRFQEEYLSYQKYFPPYLEWAVPEPHNLFLAVWLETGFLGLIGFLLLLLRAFICLYRTYKETSNGEIRALLKILGSLLVLFLVSGLVDTPYFGTDSAFSFWLLIALIFTTTKNRFVENEPAGKTFEDHKSIR